MNCPRCGDKMDETYEHLGEEICEDCYMDALSPAKSCDPWASYTASRLETQEEDLTPAQRTILETLAQGPVELGEMQSRLGLNQTQFTREFAPLHHMEKVRAFPRGTQKYLIMFDQPNPDWADV